MPYASWLRDPVVRGILTANLMTCAAALLLSWSLLHLLWPFWIQSVVIGVFARRRMLALRQFRVDGIEINGRAMLENEDSKRQMANFFALHCGLFHVVYLMFLLAFSFATGENGITIESSSSASTAASFAFSPVTILDVLLFGALGYAFWRAHAQAHQAHLAADAASRPHIAGMMGVPYLRVLPMHLTLLVGLALGGAFGAILLFMALKMVADLGMHHFEQTRLQALQGNANAREN